MAIDTKTAVLGVLLIGIVAMAGWVGFLYVNPVTKTRTKTEEDTETVYSTITVVEEYGIPDDWSDAELDASFSVYNETGGEITVTMIDIYNGIMLFYEQEADLDQRKLHDHKPEYMEVITVEDESTGRIFSGVNILDVLQFCETYFAWEISCKTNDIILDPDIYFNMTTGDIILGEDSNMPTIVAIAADGEWLHNLDYGSFAVIRGQSLNSIYDLQEIRTISEWDVKLYVNNTLQDFRVNRTNIIDPYNPDGDHYEYHKKVQNFGGRYNYNKTYWGVNMSYIINQTSAFGKNYTMNIVSIDGPAQDIYNITDIDNGLCYNASYGLINATRDPVTQEWENATALPKTDLLMTIIYKDWRLQEYGQFASDPVWDKAYVSGYNGGPFSMVIPGMTKNLYPGFIIEIRITAYDGPIP